MKVPLSWLKEYVDVDLPVKELAHRLTMAGTEVSSITAVGGSWDNVYVGHVLSVAPHPNADRLKVIDVTLGQEQYTVVCGALNVQAGQKVAFAKVGARLINPKTGGYGTLEAANLRGVVSNGMVCSERELGLGEDHTGIVVLSPDAPLGMPLYQLLGHVILDLEVTPNRGDCLSVLGIAHEVAALTGKTVREPDISYPEDGPPVGDLVSVEVHDHHLCPRYTGSLITGVSIGPSPQWMQERLTRAGMRPINNVVDVTNYVMLEYNQPLHAFDSDLIAEHRVLVRPARPGELLISLDGEERKLEPPMLVIADPKGPVGLAGVIGGTNSEVSENTRAVFLESACFDALNTRCTANALKARTEAAVRFEKGLSPHLPPIALRRATQLIVQLAGGVAAQGIIDVHQGKLPDLPRITLTSERVKKVLGVEVSPEETQKTLASLGLECPDEASGPKGSFTVTVPHWRTDLTIEDDLVEELARVRGYDQIPTTMLSALIPQHQPDPPRALRERVRDILVGLGMQEVITYTLVSLQLLEKVHAIYPELKPLRLANAMNLEQEYLRTSLRGSILRVVASNQHQQDTGLRLFEIGRVYLPQRDNLPQEKEMLVATFAGPASNPYWQEHLRDMDFLDAKGAIEALLERLGLAATFRPHGDPLFHPGRCAFVVANERTVGILGEVHPKVLEGFEIAAPLVAFFELDLAAVLEALPKERGRYDPLPRYPGVVRDMALVVDTQVPAQRVQDILKSNPLVKEAVLFDLYQGEKIAAGKKSVAYRLTFQSPGGTLTSEEVNKVQEQILQRLQEEIGATLRT